MEMRDGLTIACYMNKKFGFCFWSRSIGLTRQKYPRYFGDKNQKPYVFTIRKGFSNAESVNPPAFRQNFFTRANGNFYFLLSFFLTGFRIECGGRAAHFSTGISIKSTMAALLKASNSILFVSHNASPSRVSSKRFCTSKTP